MMFLFLTVVLLVAFPICWGELTEIKIVEEPSSLGFQQSYGNLYQPEEDTLKLKVQPANFSGPIHFSRLIGRCFHTVIEDYKYNFCPFSNITQHEQNNHWNPYKGVLGVWQEWVVNNNSFTAMSMKDGDACGDIFRSVTILFLCGNNSGIMNVTEPARCSYELLFQTPLVCAKDAMLVYPTLTPALRHEWDLLEGEKAVGDLTEKGYSKRLRSIFESGGIYLSHKDKEALVKKEEEKTQSQDTEFSELSVCNNQYNRLKALNVALSHQLSTFNESGPQT